MRIFPFNIKQPTWINYSNYLNWVSKDILSLKDYLKTFNPDFKILNQDLSACASNTWSDTTILGDLETNQVFTTLMIGEKEVHVYFPAELHYREGVFAPQTDYYICLDIYYKTHKEELIRDWEILLSAKKVIPLTANQVVISTRKIQGVESTNAELKSLLSSYLILSQPSAGLYKIQNVMNGLFFNFVENGQSALGGNISFVIELTPTRYFISDIGKYGYWEKHKLEWSIQGGYWENTNSDLTLITQNKLGSVWTNSYPLLHKTYIQNNNTFEEFVFDHSFSNKEISISSHNTSLYTLTADLAETEVTTDVWEQIYVSII